MIIETGFALNGPWGLLALMAMAVAMLVNRAGASMVFFDVVGRFQAQRLIKDADTSMTVFNSIMLDTFANMQDSLNVVGTSIEGLVTSVLPFTEAMEDAEIELRKFLDASEDIDQIADGVRRVGVEFGFTGDQALSAAAKMAQLASVLGPGQTEVGTQLGMEFGLISGMETEAAMQRLINLNQQLFFMTKNTEDLATAEEKGTKIRENTLAVMDQLNTIENRSASTMEQVTFVMNQFASQAHLTGESIAMMAAQSAVLIETGEEQGKAGRALRMIYARLGADTNGARKELEALNISVEDSNGNLRPLSQILGDLSGQWNEITKAERQAIAQSVAGNRHYTRFIKLMDNYERATQLAHEGQMALFPALEEVNNRLSEQITGFRSAEAELSNYRAELGENLLPALTLATENQAKFTLFVSDLVAALPEAAQGAAALGLNLKNIIVPVLGVVTNIAALTVAMQAQRAVSRAMAGDQLVNEEAFSRVGTSYQSASDSLAELNSLKREFVNMSKTELNLLGELSDEGREAHQDILRQTTQEINATKAKIAEKDAELANARELVQERKIEHQQAVINDEDSTITQRNLQLEQIEYEELRLKIMKLNAILEEKQAIEQESSSLLARDRLTTLRAERQATEEMNDANARAAQSMFALGGAVIGVGGALVTMTDNATANKVGMSLMTAGAAALAAQQVALAGSTLIKVAADKMALDTSEKNTFAIMGEIGATTSKTIADRFAAIQTAFSSATTNADTGARTINTAAIFAQVAALKAFIAANLLATAGVAAGIAVLIGTFVALSAAEKKRKREMEEMSNATQNFVQSDTEMFMDTLLDQEQSLDSLIAKYQDATAAVNRYAGGSVAATEALNEQNLVDQKTLGEVLQVRLAGILEESEITKEEIQSVVDALDELETGAGARRRGVLFDEFNLLTGENITQKAIDDAKLTLEEFEDLVLFIELSGKEGADAILNAIQSNASALGTLQGDSNALAEGVANAMEEATQSVLDFNSAREELFYGMAASNITGDLVRQVVNRGVENLLVNTEVIMTNNFNGMTTEQAAQEILDHVERGARMRGVDMTTTSQSI